MSGKRAQQRNTTTMQRSTVRSVPNCLPRMSISFSAEPLPMLSDVFLFCGRKCRTHFTRGDVLAAWNYTVVHPCHRLPSSFFLDYHLAVLQLHYLTPACNQVKVWRESDRNCGLNGVDDTFVTLTFIVVQVHKSRYLSVAKTSSEIIPTSLAEWPASGIVFSSEIGQALCSSQARKEID